MAYRFKKALGVCLTLGVLATGAAAQQTTQTFREEVIEALKAVGNTTLANNIKNNINGPYTDPILWNIVCGNNPQLEVESRTNPDAECPPLQN